MSYDLTLSRLPHGADADAAYHALMEQEEADAGDFDGRLTRSIPDSSRQEMQQLAGELKGQHPAFVQFETTSPLPHIELNDEQLQVQVIIYERTVAITVPYFRKHASSMMACIKRCIEVLNSVAGFVAYDPQLGRIVTTADIDDMVKQYRQMDSALPVILAHNRADKKPWWKFW